MLALQMHAMRGSQLGRHYTEAAQVARDQMERSLRTRLGRRGDGAHGLDRPVDRAGHEVQSDGDGGHVEQTFSVDWRIVADAWPTDPADRVRTVDVRVTWYEANDEPRRRRRAGATRSRASRFNDGN